MWSLLLGPILTTINTIVDKIFPDATKAAELKAQLALELMKDDNAVQLATINAINSTMQAEAHSEHWPQYSWRPIIGFTFAAILLNNYLLLPYLANYGILPIDIPSTVWSAFLVVLGAASAGRSWEKVSGKTNGNGG